MENRLKVLNLINDIENIFPVYNWRINNVKVWPIIRIQLFSELTANNSANSLQITKKQIQTSRRNKTIFDFQGKPDCVFLSDSVRRTFIMNKWFDRICDPLTMEIERLGYCTLILETSIGNVDYNPKFSNTIYMQNYIIEFLKLQSSFNHVDTDFPKHEGVKIFLKEKGFVTNALNLDIIVGVYNKLENLCKLYKASLEILKPKIAFVVCYYGIHGFAFNLACSRLNIPTIELQHGAHGAYHVAYGKWLNVPEEGYELLPGYFWCWDRSDVETILDWNRNVSDHHSPILGGNLWVSMWQQENQITDYYDRKLSKLVKSDQTNILLSLQPLSGLDGWDSVIPEWLFKLLEESSQKYKWWIRFHPHMFESFQDQITEIRGRIKNLSHDCSIDIDQASSLPLIPLLKKMDLHVTAFSSVIIEAESMGKLSIAIHSVALRKYPDQIKNGSLKYASSKEEFLKIVESSKGLQVYNLKPGNTNISLKKVIGDLENKKTIEVKPEDGEEKDYIILLYLNAKFNELITKYENGNTACSNYYVGKSYFKMNNPVKGEVFFKEALSAIGDAGINSLLDALILVDLQDYFENENKKEFVDCANEQINKLENSPYITGELIKYLFEAMEYRKIIKFKKNTSLNSLFYIGRAYKQLENFSCAISYLEQYIKNNLEKEENEQRSDYIVSAFFHLGEAYIKMFRKSEAVKCFTKCQELTKGKHSMARKYLGELLSD